MLISDHLSFNTMISVGFFDLTNFRELEIQKYFCLFLVQMRALEFSFEIY